MKQYRQVNSIALNCLCMILFLLAGTVKAQSAQQAQNMQDSRISPLFGHHVFGEVRDARYYRVQTYAGMIDELQQEISINFENTSINTVLREIARQADLGIAYSSEWRNMEKKVSVYLDNGTVAEGLNLVLADVGYEAAISSRRELIFVRKAEALPVAREVQETGTIRGRIVDQMTGEDLPGANILVQGTDIGTATDNEGNYTLSRVPAGSYILEVRYLGYHSHEVSVTVEPDETVELDIAIMPDVLEGEELTIMTQALGQARAIQQQRQSNTIVNVVSEERLRELADANAAESLGRLPGVSIVRDGGEARNVAIRGMSSRYNNITFDGVRMPSTDFGGRSVDLNFISQEMLSGIELYKSNRPDMDADAIGGTVNFSLTRIPEEAVARFNFRGGYNDHVNEISNYSASFSGSNRFFDKKLGIATSLDIQRNDRSSDVLRSDYTVVRPRLPGESHAPLEVNSMDVSVRNEVRDRIGGSLMFDVAIPNGTIYLSTFGSRLNRDIGELSRRLALEAGRQDWHYRTQDIEVDVFSTRLSGEHRIPFLGNMQVEWLGAYSISAREHPFDHVAQFRELNAFEDEMDRRGAPETLTPFARNNFRNTELHRTDLVDTQVSETDLLGQIDITIPYQINHRIFGDLKFGGKMVNKTRDRTNEMISLFMPNHNDQDMIADEDRDMVTSERGHISMLNYTNPDFERDNLFLGNFGVPIGLDRDPVNSIQDLHRRRYEEDLSAPTDNQSGTERISASYIMTELNLGSRLMVMPGVRYEHYNGDYDAMHGVMAGTMNHIGWIADTTATQNYDQWFPMIQMRYEMTDWLYMRAAITKSTARADFSEMVPRSAINPEGRWVRKGNPALKPSTATNYDLIFTFFGNRLGMLSLGGFYKDIENLIYLREQRILNDYEELGVSHNERNFTLTHPQNNPLATTVRGAEIEWQSNFTHLPYPLNGIVINANFTAMKTETQYPRSEAVRTAEGVVRVDTFRVGRMPDQPDFVSNISVGYDYRGFSARVTMLYQGEQLFVIGRRPEFDRTTEKIWRWDAVVRQRLYGDLLSIYLNLHNITNEPDAASLFSDAFPTRREYFGRAFDLGIRLTF